MGAGVNANPRSSIKLTFVCCLSHEVMPDSFAILWTIAHQAPLSVGFPRQEYQSGLPFPTSP